MDIPREKEFMAREVIILKRDDFDRTTLSADDIPIEFTFENVTYVIDLTAEHVEEFREYLQPYMDAAHEKIKVKRSSATINDAVPGETTKDRAKIRKWAWKQGMSVPIRGKIPRDIRAAYEAAHGGPVIQGPLDSTGVVAIDSEAAEGILIEADKYKCNSAGVSQHMREWAKENGHPVHGGYLRAEIRQLYREAMTESQDRHPAQLALNGAAHQ